MLRLCAIRSIRRARTHGQLLSRKPRAGRVVHLATGLALAGAVALAAGAAAAANVPQVPGGDIFGFSASADAGKPGDHGGGIEFDGAIGKRFGHYRVFGQKYFYERVIAPQTSLGIGVFTAWHSIRNLPAEPINRDSVQFDGASFELARRFVERSAGNPFSFKIAIEPRWARLTGGGRHTNAFGAELKLVFDAVIIPGMLYWAGNIVLAAARERDPEVHSQYSTGSQVKVSNALTYQFSERVFTGAELTYLRAYSKFFAQSNGQAWFLGPTLFVKIHDKASLNVTIALQIAGRARGTPMHLDLDNFTRMISRVKLAVEF